MNRTEVRDLLLQAADSSYKEFNDKLTNCDTAPSIGVRVPEIRKIAKEVIKNGWEEYLEEMEALPGQITEKAGLELHLEGVGRELHSENAGQELYLEQTGEAKAPRGYLPLLQEEHMLQGIVIGGAKMDDEARICHLDLWVPGILSWADCDCSVSSMKFMKKAPEFWFTYCTGWLTKEQPPFAVRFALVALMQYYINEEYIDRVLEIFTSPFGYTAAYDLQAPQDDAYYIKMAQAWALSVCFVKYRDKTLRLLEEQRMDAWVKNKAIQKCRESYRVSAEDKELLKTLKI